MDYTANQRLKQASGSRPPHAIYLSPHLDDAALSCGGDIWRQVQHGHPVLVVTIFAGVPEPDAPLSPLAQALHDRWELPHDAVTNRLEEDRAALNLLGAAADRWTYTDCIYRQAPDGSFLYPGEEALWGQIHPLEERLIAELADRFAQLPLHPTSALYAPLAVGHHVDHQIVRRAAESTGLRLTYYEDYPYALNRSAVQTALGDDDVNDIGDDRWRAHPVSLPEEALASKIAAIACYHSQISSFWADEAGMAASVREFTEQYWTPAP